MKYASLCCLSLAFIGLSSCQRPDPGDDTDGLYLLWYWAGSKIEDKHAPGGFARSHNYPKSCAANGEGERGQISLIANPEQMVIVRGRTGMRLRLFNRTGRSNCFQHVIPTCILLGKHAQKTGTGKPSTRSLGRSVGTASTIFSFRPMS